jgi:hypothetical protein
MIDAILALGDETAALAGGRALIVASVASDILWALGGRRIA